MQVGTVDVHPQLALTGAHDLAQPNGREASLDSSVGPPIDAGGPVFGRLWCGSRGHDCSIGTPRASGKRAHVGPRARREEVEPVPAFQHTDDRRRRDARAKRLGPVRHIRGLERKTAQRIARE